MISFFKSIKHSGESESLCNINAEVLRRFHLASCSLKSLFKLQLTCYSPAPTSSAVTTHDAFQGFLLTRVVTHLPSAQVRARWSCLHGTPCAHIHPSLSMWGRGLLICRAYAFNLVILGFVFAKVFYVGCLRNLQKLRIHTSYYLNIYENKYIAINAIH